MNDFLPRILRIIPVFMMFSGFYLTSFQLFSQNGNNPNPDQFSHSMLHKNLEPGNIPTTSTVITIGNWDNFNLGVDFGTGNMTANPTIPTWYFTAYNTNVGHQSENGLEWISEIPDFGATMMGDPVVAYDSLGNLFYGNLFGTNIVLGLKVMKSSDNGTTWGPGITALTGTDKPWIACDQTNGPNANNIYTCMTNNGSGNFSVSTDHGQTFTSTFTPATQTIPGMMVCVGPNNNIQGGSVYVVTNSGTQFASIYTFYRSNDGGLTFTKMSSEQFSNYVGTEMNGKNSVSEMRTHPYPLIAADNSYGPHRGRLYLVYASNDPPGNGNMPDIFSRYSDNGGATWSAAKKVNDDPDTQSNDQWHPAIWCDKDNGRLYVQWMDTRDTPTHDSAFIYATYSSDGGDSFATNQRISNRKMKINCTTCGGSGNPVYEGDYNGICSNKKVAIAGWTDFRYGTFMSTTAYFPDFAMALDHSIDTLFTTLDSTIFNISIPEVKLYTDTVLLSDSINPVPVSGTITVSFPSGNRITSFPDSLPAKVKLTGAVPTGYYNVDFFAKSPNGTPVHQRNATIRVLSGDSVYVVTTATPDSICAGESSQLLARTIKGVQPISFSWTPVTGLNNPHIPNPVASPLVNTLYRVHVIDSVSHSANDSVLISIIPAPNTPGTISGPVVICHDSIAVYSIQIVPHATSYSWMVPDGAQILSGQNTPSVTIQWGTTSGSVSVISGDQCGISNPSVLEVTVINIPSQPTIIQGPEQVCNEEKVTFSVDPVPDATSYFWTVPADATIINGQNTDSIYVQWGTNAGYITIMTLNNCGESLPLTQFISLETLPGPAGIITGNDTVCSNYETYDYSVPLINGATSYTWTVPSGTLITSGTGTNSIVITVSPGAISDDITVEGKNTCGSGTASVKNIIVKVCAGIPENKKETGIAVFPNPAVSELNIAITGGENQMDLRIIDVRGQTVFSQSLNNIPHDFRQMVDVSAFSKGVYFVELTGSTTFVIRKVILQ
jgi:hypothetical protein